MLYTQTFCFQNLLFTEDSSFLLWFLKSQNVSHLGFCIYKELEFIGEPLWEAMMVFYSFLMFSSMSLNLHLHSQIRGHSFTWNSFANKNGCFLGVWFVLKQNQQVVKFPREWHSDVRARHLASCPARLTKAACKASCSWAQAQHTKNCRAQAGW